MFIANIRTRSEIFELDGYNYRSQVLDIVYLRKYLNSMALTIRTQQKTAINIEFNFGLYRT